MGVSESSAGPFGGGEHASPQPASSRRSRIRDVPAKGGRALRTRVGDERSPLNPTDEPRRWRPDAEAAVAAGMTPTRAPTAGAGPQRRSDCPERAAPPPDERPSLGSGAKQAGDSVHRVVIVGGGFGGLRAALGLRHDDIDITVIDRRNFHLFQPLTYQVATGALTPGEIARPLRAIFRRYPNVKVLLADVDGFDLQAHEVHLSSRAGVRVPSAVSYDSLIVAGGSDYSYFGHDEWRAFATEVKSLESALLVRRRLVSAFEAAEAEPDPERRACWLSFVVVGAGPTGVEMAGQIAELARAHLRRQFRNIDPQTVRIVLIEAGDRILPSFPTSLSASATRSLQRLGVTVLTNHTVTQVDAEGVITEDGAGAPRPVEGRTVIWAAGVVASGLAATLAELTGADLDAAGRVAVEADLTLPGHPEVRALGDMVRVRGADGVARTLPGVAPVAMQQGWYAAKAVRASLRSRTVPPFRYRDKGNLATIGRLAAVADIGGLRLSGLVAWVTWLSVHLWYLVGFQNRLLVFIRWSFSFFSHGDAAWLITGADSDAACRPSGR